MVWKFAGLPGGIWQISTFEAGVWTPYTNNAAVMLNDLAWWSASEGWAVGDDGRAVRWDGDRWNEVQVPTTDDLLSVWAGGPTDVWLAGGFSPGD